jgi:hypothetical protein
VLPNSYCGLSVPIRSKCGDEQHGNFKVTLDEAKLLLEVALLDLPALHTTLIGYDDYLMSLLVKTL